MAALPMTQSPLAAEFEHYSAWHDQVAVRLSALQNWLTARGLDGDDASLRLAQLQDRLDQDTLNVAFVAEFSRGKSELINAIFFADYRQRVLPSSAGRTTMCPTELSYDPSCPPSLRLLPIQTKAQRGTVADFKRDPSAWSEIPLVLDAVDEMKAALQHLADVIRVSGEEAREYGLINPQDEETARVLAHDGSIEIPRWRHALINFPHPLLERGLVILDTPGLNAIGTEPELTLSLLPNAHAVLFLLAADTGVTRSDIEVWRKYLAPVQGASRGRLVVMNKIDGLWDDLKTADDIAAEIDRQVATSAELLGLPATQVYPVSAQKALVAKIRNDPALLERSRLPELEAALSRELIPGKQDLVRESTLGAVEDVVVQTTELLEARLAAIQDQIDELVHLRGKNRDVIGQMMAKANEDQQHFERGLAQFTAMRRLFAGQVAIVRADIGMETLRSQVHVTRAGMEKSLFTHGLREAMREFFRRLEHNLGHADEKIEEIHAMLGAMYRKFSEEHGLAAVNPPAHTLARYRKEMARLERIFNERFNTVFKLLTLEQHRLTAQFFETLAARVIDVFEVANRETEAWFKALIAPMETQVREHQAQLKRRVESVSRIHAATETLDERIGELEAAAQTVTDQLDELARLHGQIVAALSDVAANPPALARRA